MKIDVAKPSLQGNLSLSLSLSQNGTSVTYLILKKPQELNSNVKHVRMYAYSYWLKMNGFFGNDVTHLQQ